MASPAPLDVHRQPREFLRALFFSAVERASPIEQVPLHLPTPPRGRTLVLGGGKASAAMALAIEAHWPAESALSGLVVTRYGHLPAGYAAEAARIRVIEAAHPVPDATGSAGAQTMLTLAQGLTADDLVICPISGGASALLSLPVPELDAGEQSALHHQLLRCGASIAEINAVRKHLSLIGGGRLAAACAPAAVLSLLISDVPGDDPAIIGSGPTVPDPSTCNDALAVLDRYGIKLPPQVIANLRNASYETPKPGDARFSRNEVRVIATPQMSLDAAAALARRHGVAAYILSDRIEGEAREVGKVHAALARQVAARNQPFARPCVILSGGETTVSVGRSSGRGGRASEFLLACAIALEATAGVYALAADTDGIDGSENNAGAFAAPDTLARAQSKACSAPEFLQRHDSYGFFAALDDLLVTGPTLTNVNDFRALLVL